MVVVGVVALVVMTAAVASCSESGRGGGSGSGKGVGSGEGGVEGGGKSWCFECRHHCCPRVPPAFQIPVRLVPPPLSRSEFLLTMPSMGLPITVPPLLSLNFASSSSSLPLIVHSSSSLAHPSSSRRTPLQTYLLMSSKCTLRFALSGRRCTGGAGWTCTASRSPLHPRQPIKIADADA